MPSQLHGILHFVELYPVRGHLGRAPLAEDDGGAASLPSGRQRWPGPSLGPVDTGGFAFWVFGFSELQSKFFAHTHTPSHTHTTHSYVHLYALSLTPIWTHLHTHSPLHIYIYTFTPIHTYTFTHIPLLLSGVFASFMLFWPHSNTLLIPYEAKGLWVSF